MLSVTDADSHVTATYDYDSSGRVAWMKDALNNFTRYQYTQRGRLHRQWGDAVDPVEYSYAPDDTGEVDDGQVQQMKTYRGGSGWSDSIWPEGTSGTADTTKWTYDPATGLLTAKTDASGRAVTHTYNARRQLATVTRPRTSSTSVTTTHGYDSVTGELISKTYSDTTPSVSYTYNRLGQVKSVTDATGTRNFNPVTGKPWRVKSEALSGFYGNRLLTRVYDESTIKGRPRGFKLGLVSNEDLDLDQTYTYTTKGQYDVLTSKRADGAVTRSFDYDHNASSGLLEKLTSGLLVVERSYHAKHDLVTSIDSRWSSVTRTRYDYTYNARHQRLTAKQSGTAFKDYHDTNPASAVPITRRFEYGAQGQLTAAIDYLGTDTSVSTGRPLPGRYHRYGFDNQGNRTASNRDIGNSSTIRDDYTFGSIGALNQYYQRENNRLPVSGTVDYDHTVAVQPGAGGGTADRQAAYYHYELAVGNSSAPWTGTLAVSASDANSYKTVNRPARLPQNPQTFTYDYDGNLTSDGIWTYGWDAENRLRSMVTTTAAAAAGYPNLAITFTYDYLGRRVQKEVRTGALFSFIAAWRYLYDGWNLVAEYDSPGGSSLGNRVRTYAWGLDVAGSRTATGGVGALVELSTYNGSGAHQATYLPTYDGNGNLAALLNASSGDPAAVYEYGPFGEPLRAQVLDANVTDQPFRFSTKFTDRETGLIYYGHRYYSPELGRFLNRDPLGEAGGNNLYGFVGNDPVNGIDYLGLAETAADRANRPRELPPLYFPPPILFETYYPSVIVRQNPHSTRGAGDRTGYLDGQTVAANSDTIEMSPATTLAPHEQVFGAGTGASNYQSEADRQLRVQKALQTLAARRPEIAKQINDAIAAGKVKNVTNSAHISQDANGIIKSALPENVSVDRSGVIVIDIMVNGNLADEHIESALLHGMVHATQELDHPGVPRTEYDAYKTQYEYERQYHREIQKTLLVYVEKYSREFYPEPIFEEIHTGRTGESGRAPITVRKSSIIRIP